MQALGVLIYLFALSEASGYSTFMQEAACKISSSDSVPVCVNHLRPVTQ